VSIEQIQINVYAYLQTEECGWQVRDEGWQGGKAGFLKERGTFKAQVEK
jgi:hypothetical protein